MIMQMNKKGDIETILLPIIALVMSIAALFSFITFSGGFEDRSLEISHILSEIEFNQNYVIAQVELIGNESINSKVDFRGNFIDVAAKRDLKIDNSGNFFGKIRNGEFSFVKNGENYVLKVDGLFVQAKRGNNAIKREFNMAITFDRNGRAIGKEIKPISTQGL